MKRPFVTLLVVCLASALAGWGLAWTQAHARQRAVADAAAKAEAADAARAKATARQIANRVRQADEVVIHYSSAPGKPEREVPVRDAAWIARLAATIESSSCEASEPGLWVSTPRLTFYRNHEDILEMMFLGKILRADGQGRGGDYSVGAEAVRSILALAQARLPDAPVNQSAKLTNPT